MRSLGADHVIDYTREDFTKNGKQYDFILDLIAYRYAFAYARALKPNGSYYAVGGSVATFLQFLLIGPWISRASGNLVRVLAVQRTRKDVDHITDFCSPLQIRPSIDTLYPFSALIQPARRRR